MTQSIRANVISAAVPGESDVDGEYQAKDQEECLDRLSIKQNYSFIEEILFHNRVIKQRNNVVPIC